MVGLVFQKFSQWAMSMRVCGVRYTEDALISTSANSRFIYSDGINDDGGYKKI